MSLKFLTCFLVFFGFVLGGCKQNKTFTEKELGEFFFDKKWNGDYASTLPLHNPDSIIIRIKTDVPEVWQSIACENAYYHLPDTPFDSLQFKYLDKIETAFPNDSVRAFVLVIRGFNLGIYSNFDSSYKCLTECYNISMKHNRLTRASDAQFYLGMFTANRNDYPEGIRLVNEAYEMALSLGGKENGRLFEIMLSTAIIYRNIEDYTSAQYWYKKLWDYSFVNRQSRNYQIRAAGYMAENYLRLHQLDSAKILIDTTFKLMDSTKNRTLEGFYLTIRAEIETERGNTASAFLDLKAASHDSVSLLQPRFGARYNKVLGLAFVAAHNLDSALIYFNKSLITTDTLFQANVESQIAKVYENKGNIAQALSHQSKSIELRNRVLSATKERALERIELKNETDHKIVEAEYKHKSTLQGEIVGVLILLSLLLISLFEMNRQKQQKLILSKEKEIIEVSERLKTLALENSEKKVAFQQEALNETSKLLEFKNTLIEDLELRLAEQTANIEIDIPLPSKAMQSLKSMRILTNSDWVRFRELFDIQYPGFIIHLKNQFSNITNAEMRLFLLIKIGFEADEIAAVLGVSYSSVYTSRYRLRKKLQLETERDLENYVQNF